MILEVRGGHVKKPMWGCMNRNSYGVRSVLAKKHSLYTKKRKQEGCLFDCLYELFLKLLSSGSTHATLCYNLVAR